MTFIAALRCDRINAPCVLEQPINGASFAEWVEQDLVPTLSPGDAVIMDNLSSHKRPAIRRVIRATNAKLLYLPPYSPDLNPIEQMVSKLKHLLRKASERSAEATWRRVGSVPGDASDRSLMPSAHKNAPMISPTPVMRQRNVILL
jgi:transposase